jgi:site-specific DNA-methyltransferase (adenine-specific)
MTPNLNYAGFEVNMSIELLNMDCMLYMTTLPDKAFDLAIVDPPYGIGESGKSNATRGSAAGANKFKGSRNTTGVGIPSTKFLEKNWDKEPPRAEYFIELQRVSKNQIVWGANHFIDRIAKPSSCWIVWDKENGDTDFADCELAWTSYNSAVRKFKFMWNGMLQGDMKNKEARIHPTQKPVKLYEWLLTNYAKPGQRILDTHLGSGSSAIAAHYFGVDFVGCELDADYYNAAKKRFEQATAQLAMFGA